MPLPSPSNVEKDHNMEFFHMCLLSFKMNNQDIDEVMELDSKKMFYKCVNIEKQEFFQF